MMSKIMIAGGVIVAVLVLAVVVLVVGYRSHGYDEEVPPDPTPEPMPSPVPAPAPAADRAGTGDPLPPGFLYGRITGIDGTTYEGRLRFGGEQEAFWGDYFNGVKGDNPWVDHVPPEELPKSRHDIEIFGFKVGSAEHEIDLGRLFMTRFGDIASIEGTPREVRVTRKNGSMFVLDRRNGSDLDEGVRVWDAARGEVDIESRQIRLIELLPTAGRGEAPERLHGTVKTSQGEYTGFVGWSRGARVGSDELHGRTAERKDVSLRFDTIRSIARGPKNSAVVTLLEGDEIELPGMRAYLGITVEDPRYGRVTIPWGIFERVDFKPGGSGPAYAEFPAGRKMTGSVRTKDGARLTGRLVYDLDESETTETLDAPSDGVDYTIPFGLVASIVPEDGSVTFHSGETLRLERENDLGERNAGLLVFVEGAQKPRYVPFAEVARIDLDRP